MSGDTPDLEYVGLMALAWDPLRGDTSGWEDRAYYLDLVRERGEPVLDVGCGTGRLLLDYLGLGIDVDGLEISAEMLAICRSKAAAAGLDVEGRLFEQAMEAMDLPRCYRTIIVPSSSFQLVVDAAAAAEALRRFHDHLVPGGTLALPFYSLAEAADESWTDEADLSDGSRIRRISVSRPNAEKRFIRIEISRVPLDEPSIGKPHDNFDRFHVQSVLQRINRGIMKMVTHCAQKL